MNRPTPRRTHLLDTAQSLFNQHGYHRTGIDTIMQVSGVSKTTLYKHFRTKEDLILALLEMRSGEILEAMEARIGTLDTRAKPTQRIAAILDVVEAWVGGEAFFGCNFIRAVSEYEAENDAITAFARSHKTKVKALIADQLVLLSAAKRAEKAEQIMLIVDGAIVSAHVRQRGDAMQTARLLVEQILR